MSTVCFGLRWIPSTVRIEAQEGGVRATMEFRSQFQFVSEADREEAQMELALLVEALADRSHSADAEIATQAR